MTDATLAQISACTGPPFGRTQTRPSQSSCLSGLASSTER